MPSSFSTDLKLELMVTGENAGTWGDKTNTNLNLVQQAIAGVESIALTDGGTVTLVMSDAAISNARNMVLKLTGTLTSASELHIPDSIEKFYIIDATSVTGPTNLTVETVSGTGFTLDQAKIYACYSDGTNVTEVSLDTLGGSIGTAGITDAAVTTAKISDNAITTAKISDAQITTAKISDNQITTAKISDNQITTAKISDNQVTAAKLDDLLTDSGGTAGDYTAASITVDATGRITAAASGSGGAGGFEPILNSNGPASGTLAINTDNQLLIYASAGSGGGSGAGRNLGSIGGNATMGVFYTPVTAPFSQPYSIGAGGAGGQGRGQQNQGNPGSPGGATSVTNLFVINGGQGSAAPGNPSTLQNGGPISPYNTTNPRDSVYIPSTKLRGGEGGRTENAGGSTGAPGCIHAFTNSAT